MRSVIVGAILLLFAFIFVARAASADAALASCHIVTCEWCN